MAEEIKNLPRTTTEPLSPEAELAAAKLAKDKPQQPSPNTKVRKFAIGESTGNMTRDNIVVFQRAKFMEQGKSEDEAHELAVKRAFEMVKDDQPQK